MTTATLLARAVLFAVPPINGREQMLGDRQNKVRNPVEVAHATVAHYAEAADAAREMHVLSASLHQVVSQFRT